MQHKWIKRINHTLLERNREKGKCTVDGFWDRRCIDAFFIHAAQKRLDLVCSTRLCALNSLACHFSRSSGFYCQSTRKPRKYWNFSSYSSEQDLFFLCTIACAQLTSLQPFRCARCSFVEGQAKRVVCA